MTEHSPVVRAMLLRAWEAGWEAHEAYMRVGPMAPEPQEHRGAYCMWNTGAGRWDGYTSDAARSLGPCLVCADRPPP